MKKTLKKAMALMLCLSVAASSVAAAEITAPAVADTADVYQTQDDGKINNQKTDEKETESESETGTVTGSGGVTVITPPSSEPETEPQKPSEPETDTPPSSEPETEPQKPSEPETDTPSSEPETEPQKPSEPETDTPPSSEPETEPQKPSEPETDTPPSSEPETETEPPQVAPTGQWLPSGSTYVYIISSNLAYALVWGDWNRRGVYHVNQKAVPNELEPGKWAFEINKQSFDCDYWQYKQKMGYYPPYPPEHAHFYEGVPDPYEPETEPDTEEPYPPETEMPEPSTEPTSEFPTEPTTEPSTEPSTEPVTEPPTESEPDSETESETETEKVNKEKLQELLQEAAKIASEHMNNPVEELTDASFKELVLAGSNASGVYKEGSSTQEEVDAAANWLELAIRTRQLLRTISAQKLKATLDSLQTEVDMVNYTIRKGMPIKYASAAWEQFADLFEATQYFYEQHCAGNGNYVEAKVIDATHSKLISSYVALQRKTTGSSGKKDTGSKKNTSSDELLDNLQDTLETINKGEYQETALEILLTALESEKKVSSEFAAGLRKLMGVLNFAKLMKDSNDAYDAHVPYEVNPKLYDWVNEHLIPTEVVPGTTENLNTIMKGLENKSRQSKDIMKTFDSEGEIKLPEYAIGDASREYINNN
ncbi:hypothetical protein [Marvinbryantia sp.]|uniref:hypothetical protein n=1 Tax=Marvinbryantia sp. TaxID=2496532 RepID=UPI003A9259C5